MRGYNGVRVVCGFYFVVCKGGAGQEGVRTSEFQSPLLLTRYREAHHMCLIISGPVCGGGVWLGVFGFGPE
jgi:hypothetical protein